ncbi:unnamed protein product [Ilex paraguariensis]|uniref:Uncharacterized protein n=1 Tax=Ilex paraguariensis TaxID=185542 RepID=A0ABC8RLQ4_9AQUA
MELLKPLTSAWSWFQEVPTWQRPATTIIVLATSLLVVYKYTRIGDKHDKIVICRGTGQTTMESIVSAQQGLKTLQEMVQSANITILKIRSIMVYRAPKELLKPLTSAWSWFQEVPTWQRPATTIIVLATSLLVVYKEWIGNAIAAFLLFMVAKMLWARYTRIGDKHDKIVICRGTGQTTMESIVSAQQGLKTLQEMVQSANITILKIRSIMVYRAPKHAKMVMMAMTGLAIILAMLPFKYILVALILYSFTMTLKVGKRMESEQGNRRSKEWWDSIPVIPVEIVVNYNPVSK